VCYGGLTFRPSGRAYRAPLNSSVRAKQGKLMKWIICVIGLLLLTGCGLKTQVVRVDTPNVHVNSENGPLIQA
jgi:uncharacterized lipoprotein YajG